MKLYKIVYLRSGPNSAIWDSTLNKLVSFFFSEEELERSLKTRHVYPFEIHVSDVDWTVLPMEPQKTRYKINPHNEWSLIPNE